MATKGDAASVALLGVALSMAVTIPTAIQAIGNATVRAIVMVLALVVLLVCAVLVKPREVATTIRNSLRPRDDDEPAPRQHITFRPPKLPSIDDEPTTEDETPHPHRRK